MKLSKLQQGKIKAFMSDKELNKAVFDVLLLTYMKKQGTDVNEKAAQMIAIDLLQDAWREMERYQAVVEGEKKIISQIGL